MTFSQSRKTKPKQTQTNPVLPALRSFSEGGSLCPRCAACPELAVALSEVEGVVEWVEWANFKPGDGFSPQVRLSAWGRLTAESLGLLITQGIGFGHRS